MTYLSQNIKWLRKLKGWTQEQLAEQLGIKRSLIGSYEEGRADPRLTTLVAMAKQFDLSVDDLLENDLSQGIKKSKTPLKVLSITVDAQDEEYIDLVPQKASAGYLNGYADPEYLEDLPKFRLPNLGNSGTYRAFEISGDSMLPLQPGSIIIGQYLEDIQDLKSGKTYVLVSSREGVVYKRVFNYLEEKGCLWLVSDNASYAPYEIKPEEVLELWEAKAYISVHFPDPSMEKASGMTLEKLSQIVLELQHEIVQLKDGQKEG